MSDPGDVEEYPNSNNAKITPEYKKALQECGFKAFWGDDASVQPGHLQEVTLHQTTIDNR